MEYEGGIEGVDGDGQLLLSPDDSELMSVAEKPVAVSIASDDIHSLVEELAQTRAELSVEELEDEALTIHHHEATIISAACHVFGW